MPCLHSGKKSWSWRRKSHRPSCRIGNPCPKPDVSARTAEKGDSHNRARTAFVLASSPVGLRRDKSDYGQARPVLSKVEVAQSDGFIRTRRGRLWDPSWRKHVWGSIEWNPRRPHDILKLPREGKRGRNWTPRQVGRRVRFGKSPRRLDLASRGGVQTRKAGLGTRNERRKATVRGETFKCGTVAVQSARCGMENPSSFACANFAVAGPETGGRKPEREARHHGETPRLATLPRGDSARRTNPERIFYGLPERHPAPVSNPRLNRRYLPGPHSSAGSSRPDLRDNSTRPTPDGSLPGDKT